MIPSLLDFLNSVPLAGLMLVVALVALKHAADSNEHAVSFAASYAIASVLVTLAGQVIVHLV